MMDNIVQKFEQVKGNYFQSPRQSKGDMTASREMSKIEEITSKIRYEADQAEARHLHSSMSATLPTKTSEKFPSPNRRFSDQPVNSKSYTMGSPESQMSRTPSVKRYKAPLPPNSKKKQVYYSYDFMKKKSFYKFKMLRWSLIVVSIATLHLKSATIRNFKPHYQWASEQRVRWVSIWQVTHPPWKSLWSVSRVQQPATSTTIAIPRSPQMSHWPTPTPFHRWRVSPIRYLLMPIILGIMWLVWWRLQNKSERSLVFIDFFSEAAILEFCLF